MILKQDKAETKRDTTETKPKKSSIKKKTKQTLTNKGNNKITEQSYKGKVKTHNYINRQNQSTTGKL